jgi:hypothetical protein
LFSTNIWLRLEKITFYLPLPSGTSFDFFARSGRSSGVPIYFGYSIGKELSAGALHRDGPDHYSWLRT